MKDLEVSFRTEPLIALFIILLILKLTKIAIISWWWVFAPLIIPIIISILIVVIYKIVLHFKSK